MMMNVYICVDENLPDITRGIDDLPEALEYARLKEQILSDSSLLRRLSILDGGSYREPLVI